MRISDWSSDVCSSDLASEVNPADFQVPLFLAQTYSSLGRKREEMKVRLGALGTIERHLKLNPHDTRALYFGAQNLVRVGDTAKAIELAERALRDRKRVVEGKSVSVRVDLGGRRFLQNKQSKRYVD